MSAGAEGLRRRPGRGQSLAGLRQRQPVGDVVAWVASVKPSVVAIDSPRSSAPPGHAHRPEEKELRAEVCGIRWTPPTGELDRNPYYEWIVEGLGSMTRSRASQSR